VSCTDSALVLVIELGKAGRHLSASRSRSSHDDKRSGSLDVVILTVAFVADDERDIGRISGYIIMKVYRNVHRLQSVLEENSALLSRKLSDHDAAHVQILLPVRLDQAENIRIICDAEISADLIFLNIFCADRDHDLSLAAQFLEKAELAVRSEAGQDSGRVVIIEKLASELKIELIVELADPVTDVFRLHLQIFFVIKTDSDLLSPVQCRSEE